MYSAFPSHSSHKAAQLNRLVTPSGESLLIGTASLCSCLKPRRIRWLLRFWYLLKPSSLAVIDFESLFHVLVARSSSRCLCCIATTAIRSHTATLGTFLFLLLPTGYNFSRNFPRASPRAILTIVVNSHRLDEDVIVLRGSPSESAGALLKGRLAFCLSETIPVRSITLVLVGIKRLQYARCFFLFVGGGL